MHRSIKLGVLFCASGKNHASSPLRKLLAAALTIIDLCQSMPAAHCNKTAFQAIAATQRVARADRSHRRLGDLRRRGPYLPRFAPTKSCNDMQSYHDGVFVVRSADVEASRTRFAPQLLRLSRTFRSGGPQSSCARGTWLSRRSKGVNCGACRPARRPGTPR